MVVCGLLLSYGLIAPPRNPAAKPGDLIAREVETAALRDRESRLEREATSGNIPPFLRRFVPVPVERTIDGRTVHARFFVAPDYLCVGSDDDRMTLNLTPYTAQRIADRLGCVLPTPAMVDAIDAAATVRLEPFPIPPTSAMTTVPVFRVHNATVVGQRAAEIARHPLGELTTGSQKDIVVCVGLGKSPGKVAIYGWRKLDGAVIQPLYLGHTATWTDYSHGTRLVAKTMEVEGKPIAVSEVLRDPKLAGLISSEGVVTQPRYAFSEFPRDGSEPLDLPDDETWQEWSPMPGVRVVIDAPKLRQAKSRLAIYALPNGNTIEQTFGRRLRPGMDWHFDIQHIGAQTRFLRASDPHESLIVAYVANDKRAWPTWLRDKAPDTAVRIIDAIINHVQPSTVALSSHSGGGALVFAYIKAISKIPPIINRIAFLDSEYNYDGDVHFEKLVDWLRTDRHYLCTLAYDDANALLDGKPFVSKAGGTWGRTHAMLRDLEGLFKFSPHLAQDPERYEALDDRVTMWFKRNPNHEIFHTVQVERNGFIESLTSGLNQSGFIYFGDRAYSKFIRD